MNCCLRTLAAAAVLGGMVLPGWSHDGHAHGAAASPAPAVQGSLVTLSDTLLQDQDGHQLRLASDAVADKVVVVTFVFTNCIDTCPTVSHTFAQLQDQLGALMEQRVRLISLTVDPARDTPARLKAYAVQHGARPGWLWLTGAQAAVTAALQDFGIRVTNFENHPVVVFVGDPRSGSWTRLYDIDNPQPLLAKVRQLLAAQPAGKVAAACPAQQPAPRSYAVTAGCVAQPQPWSLPRQVRGQASSGKAREQQHPLQESS